MAALSAWIDRERPDAVVADVSVEVALLARLHGVPVVSVVLPGHRGDRPHREAYAVSAGLVAAWPRAGRRDGRRAPAGRPATTAPHRRPVAADARHRPADTGASNGPGALGPGRWASHRRAGRDRGGRCARWTWRVLGGSGEWRDDPTAALDDADVVVVQAGESAVADVAASRRPAVVVPAARPFGEQDATATGSPPGRLAVPGPAAVPGRVGWPALLDEVADLDGGAWATWCDGGAADRFADATSRPSSAPVAGASHEPDDRRGDHRPRPAPPPAPAARVACWLGAPCPTTTWSWPWTTRSWRSGGPAGSDPRIVRVAGRRRGLPLAAARNLGFALAIEAGADVVVGLDVDCMVGPDCSGGVPRRGLARARRPVVRPRHVPAGRGPRLRPRTTLVDLDDPHPARPAPRAGERLLGGDPDLFWSLSFAAHADAWTRVGGFCEEYAGYGGEDTDLAHLWAASGSLARLGRRRPRLPPAPPDRGAARAAPRRHPAQRRALRTSAGDAGRWRAGSTEMERMGLVAQARTVSGSHDDPDPRSPCGGHCPRSWWHRCRRTTSTSVICPRRTTRVRRLPDPDPDDPRRSAQEGWWPPVMLDPAWIEAADFDVFHLQFGFDAWSPRAAA